VVYTGLFVGKSEGKQTFGRPRRRWEDNIKMYASKFVSKNECK